MTKRLLGFVIFATLLAIPFIAAAQDKGAAGDNERIDKTLNLKAGGSVSVENDRGSTTIDGWDKEQVSVEAVKHFEGSEKLRVDWLRQTEVRIDGTSDHVGIRVIRPSNFCIGFCNFRAWVDLTIHVPRRVSLDLKSDRTPTKVTNVQGDVRVNGDRSQIDLRNISGSIHIESDRGPVFMRDVAISDGVNVRTDRAPIELYATKLAGGGRLETDRAPITVRMPQNTPITVEVRRDRRSNFRTDFPLSTTGNLSGYGTLRGNINGGGATLQLSTDRGSISLEKGPAL